MSNSSYIETYLKETTAIAQKLDRTSILEAIQRLHDLRKRSGRLFILGVGGSAGNASHAVNDFRKIAKIESYAPTDNVSELTAWTNDDGWEGVFKNWLIGSNLKESDLLLIFSVGGGSDKTSRNLVEAMLLAKQKKTPIVAIVSRDGGKAKELADVAILVPVVSEKRITPHAEGWQAIVWHLLVNALVEQD
jgi:D-sedoheptulose 7-phosphate isomerase